MHVDGIAIMGTSRSGMDNSSVSGNFTLKTLTDTFANGGGQVPHKAGDVVFCNVFAHGPDANVPAFVQPAGFTHYLAHAAATSTGKGCRMDGFFKVLTAADIGATFTGTFGGGGGRTRLALVQLALSRPCQGILNWANNHAYSGGGDPGDVVTATPAGEKGHLLYFGAMHGQTTIQGPGIDMHLVPQVGANGPYFNPNIGTIADNAIGGASTTRSCFNFYSSGFPRSESNLGLTNMGEFSYISNSVFQLL